MAGWYARIGDVNIPITVTLSDATGPVVLTGATVVFHAKRIGATDAISGTAALADQTTTPGKCTYTLTAGNLDITHAAGSYKVEWQVTFPTGRVATWPNPGFDLLDLAPQLA